jgi:hypothetical protein
VEPDPLEVSEDRVDRGVLESWNDPLERKAENWTTLEQIFLGTWLIFGVLELIKQPFSQGH